jgi:hypothetical protein
MNIFRIYFTILQFAIWMGIADGAVGFAKLMRDQAVKAHTHHQIDRAKFTRIMTEQDGVDMNLRKQTTKKR